VLNAAFSHGALCNLRCREIGTGGLGFDAFLTRVIMKNRRTDCSRYDMPELEETEFALSVSPCHRIEDANDIGEIGDSFSIGLDPIDELSASDS
jgi:hypothetical protein